MGGAERFGLIGGVVELTEDGMEFDGLGVARVISAEGLDSCLSVACISLRRFSYRARALVACPRGPMGQR